MNKTKTSFLLLTYVAAFVVLGMSSAYAQPAVTVSVPSGTSVMGCEETNECYIPYEVAIDVGSQVTWINDDSAAHTVTSGTPEDGPDGVFDSSLFMSNAEFSHTFTEAGTFNYFCMVHPWMQGVVLVGGAEQNVDKGKMFNLDNIMAEIKTDEGSMNEPMTISLTMTDLDGSGIEHITYTIKATQGSKTVLDEEGHLHKGTITNTHTTSALPMDASDSMPVIINVESVGFGHDEQFVAVSGKIATKQVVPEFGTIALMILGIAIVSIIGLSAKSRLGMMPKF